jgi:hypothetical protein
MSTTMSLAVAGKRLRNTPNLSRITKLLPNEKEVFRALLDNLFLIDF